MTPAWLLALALPAAAAEPSWVRADPVMTAALAELARSKDRLAVGESRPYYIAYRLLDQRRVIVEAQFGALKASTEERKRYAGADVRVGSAAFDNTDYVSADGGGHAPFTIEAPYEDGAPGVRHALWWLTDSAFKSAVQRYSQKDAYRRSKEEEDDLPDLTPAPVSALDLAEPVAPLPAADAEALARRVSAMFRRSKDLQGCRVGVFMFDNLARFLDTEGRRSRRDASDYEVVLDAWTQADDGSPLAEQRRFPARRPSDIPSAERLESEAREMAASLTARRVAPSLDAPYIGPVLFEGQAAGEFFNQLLARGLAAPREMWLEDEGLLEAYRPGRLARRLGLRVMSPLLSAYDDPAASEFEGTALAGRTLIDDEGVPAVRVGLVEKGVLKDLYVGRAAVEGRAGSNGHSRSALENLPSPRAANLFVAADPALPRAALKAELLRRAQEAGLSWAVLVRRLGEEDARRDGSLLAPPVAAFRVNLDGSEEALEGALFDAVTMRTLRDVAAASAERRVYNHYQRGPYGQQGDDVHATIVHPDVLVSEMDLVPDEREPDRLPRLKSPLAAGLAR
ncbi:hypothetical protein EPO15_16650 [bacterium]|nr:MAG: hypothetical protein EPO15_16650 [bacterium]